MVPLHALFEKRIDGDDALLELGRRRFEQAGLAAEVYAASASELGWMLSYAPSTPHRPTVHLPRDIDLLAPGAADRVRAIAEPFGEAVSGFVVHDRRTMPDRLPDLVAVAREISALLSATGSARLFVEYAAGLPVERFLSIGAALADVERVGVCVDTGHVGIRQARREFARRRPDVSRDLLAMTVREPGLDELLDDVRAAVASALPTVVGLFHALGEQGKPVHVHLHDGHPLVDGLADHFGFLGQLTVPAGPALAPLYGVDGLRQLVRSIDSALGPGLASINLEIHEHEGRLPLPEGDGAELFSGWTDRTNAERQNLWLRELTENALLVRAELAA